MKRYERGKRSKEGGGDLRVVWVCMSVEERDRKVRTDRRGSKRG